MPKYIAGRVILGKLNYKAVTEKYPEFKAEVDTIIKESGYIVNSDGTVSKK